MDDILIQYQNIKIYHVLLVSYLGNIKISNGYDILIKYDDIFIISKYHDNIKILIFLMFCNPAT